MKKCWINQGSFYNVYSLYYTENDEQEKLLQASLPDVERITRKEAIQRCISEKFSRKHDPSFSGYGDTVIKPVLESRRKFGGNGLADDYELDNFYFTEIENHYFIVVKQKRSK